MENKETKGGVAAPAKPEAPSKTPPKKISVPKKRPKWFKWLKRLVTFAVLAAVVFFLLRGCAGGPVTAGMGSYLAEHASMQDLTVFVSGTGTIQPNNSYKVTTLVRGEILEAPFEEGQSIHKDDLLFRIDAKDVETAIEQAQLAIPQAEAGVRQAEAAVRQAEAGVRQAELNLEQAELNFRNINNNAKDATLTSNATGIISHLYVDEGDNIVAGAQVADILDRSTMKLKVPFHSADAAGIALGQSATVVVDGTAESLIGTVTEISALEQVGPGGTLTRTVTISVSNPGVITNQSTGTAAVGTLSCSANGPFEYAAQKTVVAKTSGELAVLSVKEGDFVTDGQTLGSFDADSITTQIETARIAVENARIGVENARTSLDNARTSLDNAHLAVENAQLTLKNAQDQLENYTITSTIDGTVIEKNLDVGDNIDSTTSTSAAAPNYPAVIYDLSALTFDMDIDELDINKIKVGQKVEITVDALDGQVFSGTVDKVNINGATVNGVTSYPVTVLVDDPDGLLPGMNVSAKIIVEHIGNVLCVPVDVVDRAGGGVVLVPGADAVYSEDGVLLSPGTIETRSVTLGRNNEDFIEILDGLKEGDVVLKQNQASSMMQMMMGG
ncbi:efflux RND transporter periplasmic adaptor subunit [Pseudoflavonifractor sp. 524-17]|uniref:efflux RND transporter periplasmic adaptor subunit n=1 Tax=Pseudoflavonifractor sp. 524-17 TaxID=2304577 RepID=UPI00137A753E|nr:efflux RND transporter periplasmic adaptor subunit [Pseudoflavonifractor sp. 524-17]NCE63474.1 efflux RND transporter periplasmic adaptor subunit [Pseudoflavonifractor sp. 524-17]